MLKPLNFNFLQFFNTCEHAHSLLPILTMAINRIKVTPVLTFTPGGTIDTPFDPCNRINMPPTMSSTQ